MGISAWGSLAFCDSSPTPSPSETTNYTIEQVCGNVSSASPVPSPSGNSADPTTQKLQYCQAAQSAQDAANADDILWKVWAGVGVICATECGISLGGINPYTSYTQFICTGVSVGAGVTDAVMTKNFANALLGVLGGGGGLAANYMFNGSSDSGKDAANAGKDSAKNNKKDFGACLAAVTATVSAVTKGMDEGSQKKSVQSNLQSALSVSSQAPAMGAGAEPQAPGLAAQGGAQSGNLSENPQAQPTTAANTSVSGTCSGAATSGMLGAAISCATAMDSTLPPFVSTPQFPANFQKIAGQPLGNFMGNASSPAQGMMGAMAGELSPSQQAQLASALSAIQPVDNGEDSYYAGGGGGGGGGDSADNGVGDMMNNFLGQLMPKKPGAASSSGVNAVAFANQHRSPASVVEDRALSIFDRVSYRYYFVRREMGGR